MNSLSDIASRAIFTAVSLAAVFVLAFAAAAAGDPGWRVGNGYWPEKQGTFAGVSPPDTATVRVFHYMNYGGDTVRAGVFGGYTQAVTVHSAYIGYKNGDGVTGNVKLTFSGSDSVTVPKRQVVYSDPVGMAVSKGSVLAVTGYCTGGTEGRAYIQKGWYETGDVSSVTRPLANTLAWDGGYPVFNFLSVEVQNLAAPSGSFLLLGDSIVIGQLATEGNSWARLLGYGADVYNAGHSGEGQQNEAAWIQNRLYPGFMPEKAIILITRTDTLLDQDNRDALVQVVDVLKTQGVEVLLGTTPPRESLSPQANIQRRDYNEWLRTFPGGADGLIDFDAAFRNITGPDHIAPGYSEDGVHPNDLGSIALFEATNDVTRIACGSCHGLPPNDQDNCSGTGRGLHGTHYYYDSPSYPKMVNGYGRCAYCHTPTTSIAPTATHNNGAADFQPAQPDFNGGTATCSNACHNNRGSSAPWGDYADPAIKLSCRSCHDDVTDSSSTTLSGGHGVHLLTNISTAYGPRLDTDDNAACSNCHPDNTADFWSTGMADDGSLKAYPHASDGTFVTSDNAAVLANLSAIRAAGQSDTCANACHKNEAVSWGGTLSCSSCHYYAATPDDSGNSASKVPLDAGHDTHFKAPNNLACGNCHAVPAGGDTSHATALPPYGPNASVLAGLGYDGSTCSSTPGSCHGTYGSPAWGSTGAGCAACHAYPLAAGRDWPAGNGHASRFDAITNAHLPATGFDKTADTYAGETADTGSCGLCHYSTGDATHRDGVVTLDPQGHAACSGGSFTVVTTVSGSDVSCDNVDCHKGKDTPNWW